MIELVESLNPGTVFGIIQHSRKFQPFREEFLAATPENKRQAIGWIEEEFRTNGSGAGFKYPERSERSDDGIIKVLEFAFGYEPDLIFMLSDAGYWRSLNGGERVPWDELRRRVRHYQQALERPAEINFIGFGVESGDASAIKRFIRREGGDYREFSRE